MNRRSFLAAATAFTLLSTTAARADEDYVMELVGRLTKQGYSDISVTRTFLGRVRIIAVNSKGKRELICNPRTGEILRDVIIDPDGGLQTATESSSSNSGGSGSSGGGDDGGNDDNDEHDDDGGHGGGDGDNSGHDSSGSDDGGGDDNSGHGSGDDD